MPTASQPRLNRSGDRLEGPRRVLTAVSLGILAFAQAVVGTWALAAPLSFYSRFPAGGHAWVALLPPYNEHLVRDVGALSLAVTVLLAVAAVVSTRLLVRTAAVAFAAYAVPHTVFHVFHLEGFSSVDAFAQTAGFVLQLALAGAALAATVRPRRRSAR
jgi:hypothetical protein